MFASFLFNCILRVSMKESIESGKVWCRQLFYNFYDQSGQFISLTFERKQFLPDAKHVLVWAYAEPGGEEIVLTRHKKRGWEIPGGKVEPGETPEAAARRELFEETGTEIGDLDWIAQYIIDADPDKEKIVKNVYTGVIQQWKELPVGFETAERALFPLATLPLEKDMSPFMQDDVFPLCRDYMTHTYKKD
ncbi:NUDIX domain-containing protein [Aneurinibacillus sp. BA2021]|nr:NUDIX domain-containing protein [Aneurinibacillus sp. BA2021]